jgi:hypothetical protein
VFWWRWRSPGHFAPHWKVNGQFPIRKYSPLLPAIDDVGWTRALPFKKSTKGGSAQNNHLPDLSAMTGVMDSCPRPIPHPSLLQFETAIRPSSRGGTNNFYKAAAQIRVSRPGAIQRS